MNETIYISDTTLRDGEQAPGVAFDTEAKVLIARQLDRLGVDEIEAGFPSSSQEEVEAIRAVSRIAGGKRVAVLIRALRADVDAARQALRYAERPVATIFAPASDLHIKVKLNQTRDAVLRMVDESIRYARRFFERVTFSTEDGTRAEDDALDQFYRVAIEAGASTVSLPDTVGYAQPEEFGQLVRHVRELVGDRIDLRVHCHNDLGMAVANSLSAIRNGANVVSGTFNGIGERAGNAALEEVLTALVVRRDYYRRAVGINMHEIYATSQLVSRLSRIGVAATKPIVGDNAFVHSAGVHQQGVVRDPQTYQVASPELIGASERGLVLGKHTGRHGLVAKLGQLGVTQVNELPLDAILTEVKRRAIDSKAVDDDALLAIVAKHDRSKP